jgi:hypothetical protein
MITTKCMNLDLSSSTVAAALCAGALGISLFCWRARDRVRRKRARRIMNSPGYETLPLLPLESRLVRSMSVSTATFFEGDSDAAEAWVRQRALEIIRANPWLAGRVVTSEQKSKGIRLLNLVHPREIKTFADIEQYVTVQHNPALLPSMSYADLRDLYMPQLVKIGAECTDSDEPLFKILFIRSSADSFTLLVSMSHLLGDGCTYYQVYSMLSEQHPVTSLTVRRRQEFQALSPGVVRLHDLVTSKCFLLRSLLHAVLPAPSSQCSVIAEVDPAWVAEQKAAYSPKKKEKEGVGERGGEGRQAVDFVSTNDILVSWFNTVLGLDYIVMAFNARGRIPSLQVRATKSKYTDNYSLLCLLLLYYYSFILTNHASLYHVCLSIRPSTYVPLLLLSLPGYFYLICRQLPHSPTVSAPRRPLPAPDPQVPHICERRALSQRSSWLPIRVRPASLVYEPSPPTQRHFLQLGNLLRRYLISCGMSLPKLAAYAPGRGRRVRAILERSHYLSLATRQAVCADCHSLDRAAARAAQWTRTRAG